MTGPGQRPEAKLAQADELVADARSARKSGDADRDAKEPEFARESWEEARGHLEDATTIYDELLQESLSDGAESVGQDSLETAKKLADAYGMLGGIHRRLGDLPQAIAAYDAGNQKEHDERFAAAINSSYNLVNRLVVRILLFPAMLEAGWSPKSEEEKLLCVDMQTELAEAEGIVDAQISGRRAGDSWALADLATLRLLLAKEAEAAIAWADFNQANPDRNAYDSSLAVLRDLCDRDLPVKAALEARIVDLEAEKKRRFGRDDTA